MSAAAVELVRLYQKHSKDIDRVVRVAQSVSVGKERLPLVMLQSLPEEVRGPLLEYVGTRGLYMTAMGLGVAAYALISIGRLAGESPHPGVSPAKDEGAQADPPINRPPAAALKPQVPTRLPAKPAGRRRGLQHTLIDIQELDLALEEMKREGIDPASPKDRQDGSRMELLTALRAQPTRTLLRAHKRQLLAIEQLRMHFPNFGGVLDWLSRNLRLRMAVKGSMSFQPILLSGPPWGGENGILKAAGRMSRSGLPEPVDRGHHSVVRPAWVAPAVESSWAGSDCAGGVPPEGGARSAGTAG